MIKIIILLQLMIFQVKNYRNYHLNTFLLRVIPLSGIALHILEVQPDFIHIPSSLLVDARRPDFPELLCLHREMQLGFLHRNTRLQEQVLQEKERKSYWSKPDIGITLYLLYLFHRRRQRGCPQVTFSVGGYQRINAHL